MKEAFTWRTACFVRVHGGPPRVRGGLADQIPCDAGRGGVADGMLLEVFSFVSRCRWNKQCCPSCQRGVSILSRKRARAVSGWDEKKAVAHAVLRYTLAAAADSGSRSVSLHTGSVRSGSFSRATQHESACFRSVAKRAKIRHDAESQEPSAGRTYPRRCKESAMVAATRLIRRGRACWSEAHRQWA